MTITRPGDPVTKPGSKWLVLLLIGFVLVAGTVPLIVSRRHNAQVEANQNGVIDALTEYAALQKQLFDKRGYYASTFDELGGEWTQVRATDSKSPTKFRGYYFKKFTAQAENAEGGAKNYLDKQGKLSGGYAIMAVPANYGYGARFTFFQSSTGGAKIYYHDLGVKTDTGARMIADYFVPKGAKVFGAAQ